MFSSAALRRRTSSRARGAPSLGAAAAAPMARAAVTRSDASTMTTLSRPWALRSATAAWLLLFRVARAWPGSGAAASSSRGLPHSSAGTFTRAPLDLSRSLSARLYTCWIV
jgi:hypothetical protein